MIDVDDLLQQFTKEGDSDDKHNAFAENFLENLAKAEVEECPICFSEMENPVVVPECMHQLYVHPFRTDDTLIELPYSCKDCIVSHIGICEEKGQVPACPTCATGHLQVAIPHTHYETFHLLPSRRTNL